MNPKPAKSSRSRQRAERERAEPGTTPGGLNTNTAQLTQNLAAIIANASQFIGGQAGASLQQAAQQIKQEAIKQEAIKQEAGGGGGVTGVEEAEANWVQCSRCETWRMVPEQWWAQIQATGDEDWFCEVRSPVRIVSMFIVQGVLVEHSVSVLLTVKKKLGSSSILSVIVVD